MEGIIILEIPMIANIDFSHSQVFQYSISYLLTQLKKKEITGTMHKIVKANGIYI